MELASLTLAELAADLRAKKISSLELCEAAIERHEGQDKKLNAYRDWAPERARAQARAADQAFAAGRDLGPLQGLPQSIKDIYGVPGYETFAGTPKALPEAWRRAGPLVEKLLGQSGVVMGKSHTVEFALGTLGLNDHWGTPYNPWDPDHHRAPGGSSSGAGVSLTEGSALIAWGSDTAGSIRCPASMTGCVGYKASNGRWPTGGIVPLSRSLDVPGPLVRSAADLAY
ncbi:MAG: amidase, partial [Alphaproteobacteria bacterium]|nr:amidase [Alphaproteobacteria bacterium]